MWPEPLPENLRPRRLCGRSRWLSPRAKVGSRSRDQQAQTGCGQCCQTRRCRRAKGSLQRPCWVVSASRWMGSPWCHQLRHLASRHRLRRQSLVSHLPSQEEVCLCTPPRLARRARPSLRVHLATALRGLTSDLSQHRARRQQQERRSHSRRFSRRRRKLPTTSQPQPLAGAAPQPLPQSQQQEAAPRRKECFSRGPLQLQARLSCRPSCRPRRHLRKWHLRHPGVTVESQTLMFGCRRSVRRPMMTATPPATAEGSVSQNAQSWRGQRGAPSPSHRFSFRTGGAMMVQLGGWRRLRRESQSSRDTAAQALGRRLLGSAFGLRGQDRLRIGSTVCEILASCKAINSAILDILISPLYRPVDAEYHW